MSGLLAEPRARKNGPEKGRSSSPEDARTVPPLHVRSLGLVSYGEALVLQEHLVGNRRARTVPDVLLLLEHPPVITLGSGADPAHVLIEAEERRLRGIELFDARRGGDVTYHGPGQLVGYAILDLKPDRRDVHRYLRDLEQVLIDALASMGVASFRVAGKTGVWTGEGKIASIGVRVSSGWITSHGFALNVGADLSEFSTIVPCGLEGATVTSLERERGEMPRLVVEGAVATAFAEIFGRRVVTDG